jgi:hypothetical protein
MVEAMGALKSGAHSEPPMGSAFQATRAPETPRTRPSGIGKADSLSTGSGSGQRLQFPPTADALLIDVPRVSPVAEAARKRPTGRPGPACHMARLSKH